MNVRLNTAQGTGAQSVLVTGATGFLGGRVVRALLREGCHVRATGRNLDAGMALARLGADFRPVDLRDRPGMVSVCAGVSAVVHSGALSSAWGAYRDFHGCNVEGTENVIEGCERHGVDRLVYVSSPSVMSRLEEQLNLTEDDPLPERFVSIYSETKKLAEDRVREAQARGLNTVILRPKAIYGPGDNAIFPRIIEAASKGRLPLIGDGETVTQLTYVDDVVRAVQLALTKVEALGKTYVIIGTEPIRIWDMLGEVIERLGYRRPSKRLSLAKAMRIARVMEFLWRVAPLPGEPPLTEYKVGILGYSQTYDGSAAERDLGYRPEVTLEEGMEKTLAALRGETEDEDSEARAVSGPTDGEARGVHLTILKAGTTHTLERFFLPRGRWKKIDVPAMFGLLDHPEEGPILFDTGYSRRFFEATRRFPHKLASVVTPASVPEDEEVVSQVKARGIAPEDVRWIILSHFDPDHYGGLRDFPNARIACSRAAWESVAGKTGWSAFRVRLLPGHLPEDMAARVYLLPELDGPAIPPFPRSLDLFGDGSIRLVEVPGHAAGQLAAFVRRDEGDEVLLAADSCWNLAMLDEESYRGGVHRMIAVDKRGQDATYAAMRRLRKERPDLLIVPTHCPRVWREIVSRQQGEPVG